MKKLTLFLSILFLAGFISAQKTIHVYNQTYIVKGDLVCEGYLGEPGMEKENMQWIDCYAHLNDHQLVYSIVYSLDKIVTFLKVFEVDITSLDLKNAKVDLELDYMSNPPFYSIKLNTLDNKTTINWTDYDGKSAPSSYKDNKLNINFNDEKKAKEYLKSLKAAAKK